MCWLSSSPWTFVGKNLVKFLPRAGLATNCDLFKQYNKCLTLEVKITFGIKNPYLHGRGTI